VSWRIAKWDAARAQGVIASGVGELPFDASVAMTDHFEVGEEVEVRLEGSASAYRVTRVEPVRWRAPASPPVMKDEEPLFAQLAELLPDRCSNLTVDESGEVRVAVEARPYEPQRVLVFTGVHSIQMPLEGRYQRVTGFDAVTFASTSEMAAAWGRLPALGLRVYRFEPERFGEAAGYVVAQRVRLEEIEK
jgi:hypothetical protein